MKPVEIDGSYGEGGGQILRTAVGLAAVTGRAVRVDRIRAGRPRPGLAAQHLTAVRAVAEICGGRLTGDTLASQTLLFEPQAPPAAGDYAWDVADARPGGSAGAVSLVLQAVVPALAVAREDSRLHIAGGTHMAWSPPFDYLRDVWVPMLEGIGITVAVELEAWGWFPVGQGRVAAQIGVPKAIRGLRLEERGRLLRVFGRAVAANLPAHIPQRMAARAESLLGAAQIPVQVWPERVRAACPGAGIFLTAEYEACRAGFSAIGEVGRSSEEVAEEAVSTLLAHRNCGAALDVHLADQLLPLLALADSPSSFTTERVSRHLTSNAYVVERFGLAEIVVESGTSHARVHVMPLERFPHAAASPGISSEEVPS